MENRSDEGIKEERREEVLREAPLLVAYIDDKSTPDAWLTTVREKALQYEDTFKLADGSQKDKNLYQRLPVIQLSPNHRLPDISMRNYIRELSSQLFLMGYELRESPDMLGTFSHDIAKRLSSLRLISHDVNKVRQMKYIRECMEAGAYYGERNTSSPSVSIETNPFKDFINDEVDMTGI